MFKGPEVGRSVDNEGERGWQSLQGKQTGQRQGELKSAFE